MKQIKQPLPPGVASLIAMDEWFSGESRWCKYSMYDNEENPTKACLLGAAYATPVKWHLSVLSLLRYVIREESIIVWNDSPNRTFADIKAAIRDAIAMAYEQVGIKAL